MVTSAPGAARAGSWATRPRSRSVWCWSTITPRSAPQWSACWVISRDSGRRFVRGRCGGAPSCVRRAAGCGAYGSVDAGREWRRRHEGYRGRFPRGAGPGVHRLLRPRALVGRLRGRRHTTSQGRPWSSSPMPGMEC